MNQLDLESVWERYVSCWKAEPGALEDIFKTCLDVDCVYTDPMSVAQGWPQLTDYMSRFHAQIPGGHFETTYFLSHHQRSIAKWNMLGGHGQLLGEGISYGEYNDARTLVSMTGFFEVPA